MKFHLTAPTETPKRKSKPDLTTEATRRIKLFDRSLYTIFMSTPISYSKSIGLRRANNYKPVEIAQINASRYPANSPSSIGSLHDIGYFEGLLSNVSNYAQVSSLDIVEVLNGETIKRELLDDISCKTYLEVSFARSEMKEPLPVSNCCQGRHSALPKGAHLASDHVSSPSSNPRGKHLLRSHSFCYIERARETSFGCRLCLSKANTLRMLQQFKVSPQYLSAMFGEPDYWSPGDFALDGQKGSTQVLGKFTTHQPPISYSWHILTHCPQNSFASSLAGRSTM